MSRCHMVDHYKSASEELSNNKMHLGVRSIACKTEKIKCYGKKNLTCLGVLHADASIAVKAGRAATADVADMGRPAVDALNPRETGPAGTCSRHIHCRRPTRS